MLKTVCEFLRLNDCSMAISNHEVCARTVNELLMLIMQLASQTKTSEEVAKLVATEASAAIMRLVPAAWDDAARLFDRARSSGIDFAQSPDLAALVPEQLLRVRFGIGLLGNMRTRMFCYMAHALGCMKFMRMPVGDKAPAPTPQDYLQPMIVSNLSQQLQELGSLQKYKTTT